MPQIAAWLTNRIIDKHPNNEVAKHLLDYLFSMGGTASLTQMDRYKLMKGRSEHDPDAHVQIPHYAEEKWTDFRFKELMIRGFRKFPKKEDKYYTLVFAKNQQADPYPCSCYFIGSNGSGKTSLFSALEDLCTGRVSAAEGREIPQVQFVPYANLSSSDMDVWLDIASGKVELQRPENSLLYKYRTFLTPFFCSEYDIRQMSAAPDLTDYILKQTGYHFTRSLLKCLDDLFVQANGDFNKLKHIFETEGLSYIPKIELVQIEEEVLKSTMESFLDMHLHPDSWNQEEVSDLTKRLEQPILGISFKKEQIQHQLKKIKEDIQQLWYHTEEEYAMIESLGIQSPYLKEYFAKLDYQCKEIMAVQKKKKEERTEIFTVGDVLRDMQVQEDLSHKLRVFNEEHLFRLNTIRKILAFLLHLLSDSKGMKTLDYVGRYLDVLDQKTASIDPNEMNEREEYEMLKRHLPELEECIAQLKTDYTILLQKAGALTQNICNSILNDYLEVDESFNIDIVDDRIEFIYRYKGYPMLPKIYLNSFRFKLYTLCVKIGMAFTVMQKTRISFPIVLDDVFYSSDFVNREKVCDFIVHVYESYDQIFKDQGALPLQIIFFSHDELVVRSAVKGMKQIAHPQDYLVGRIFPHEEMEEENQPLCNLAYVFE